MDPSDHNIPDNDRRLIQELRRLLDAEAYEELYHRAQERFEKGFERLGPGSKAVVVAELANRLIDAGEEGVICEAIGLGIDLYTSHRRLIDREITTPRIDYNLGNGKFALYNCRDAQTSPSQKLQSNTLLVQAKNHYWRALKNTESESGTDGQRIRTNLANCLREAGRHVEALQYYDEVLRDDPEFAKAHGNRASTLRLIASVSAWPENLIHQMIWGYQKGAQGNRVPTAGRRRWDRQAEKLLARLHQAGKDVPDPTQERDSTKEEFNDHSEYRQFCLRNFLSMSEHGLYCWCTAARDDDLTVRTSGLQMEAPFIDAMEYRLDRLKSEFSLARYAFSQAQNTSDPVPDVIDERITFAEVLPSESLGLRTELLRSSFRTCFGILDKIARGLCDLLGLTVDEKESVNFHQSLWKPGTDRWDEITSVEGNIFLTALFSQAMDVSQHTDGEWAMYRRWRNALEHGYFVLGKGNDPDGVLKGSKPIERVLATSFLEKTLHLLQLTRASMFYFAYCARVEGWKFQRSDRADNL